MDKSYCVYEHVFPNGKRYIGITCDTEKRWRNGKGYETQGKIANAINHYGWENIEHNIIVSGLTVEQANALERYLIAGLNTVENGYNTAIGGDNILATYLSPYVLAMLRYAKKWESLCEIPTVKIVDEARKDKEKSDFWNEAARAVTIKHGEYSSTNYDSVLAFWHCMTMYGLLHVKRMRGEDVSGWREVPPIFEGKKHG